MIKPLKTIPAGKSALPKVTEQEIKNSRCPNSAQNNFRPWIWDRNYSARSGTGRTHAELETKSAGVRTVPRIISGPGSGTEIILPSQVLVGHMRNWNKKGDVSV